jgi:hypothetical protein
MRNRTALGALLGSALCLATFAAGAAEYHIADRNTAALAAAIRDANASPQADVIHLAGDGLYFFAQASEGDLVLPRVAGTLTLQGHGAEIRRDTGESLALLEVVAGATLVVHHLTLAEGGRGSVRNHGTLRLFDSAIVDGTTHHESAIVQNYGRFEAERSVIGYNQVAGAGRDAAIVVNYGVMSLGDCKLAGNSLSRRWPTLAAAPVINYGEMRTRGMVFEDNAVIDGFDGLASDDLLNLGVGRIAAQ